MKDIYQTYRLAINKNRAAVMRCTLYVLAAILPDLVSELKGYKEFSDMSPMICVTLFFNLMYDAVIQMASFMDNTMAKTQSAAGETPPVIPSNTTTTVPPPAPV